MALPGHWKPLERASTPAENAMNRDESARYAIYYAPEEGSSLHEFGSRWLGRDAIRGVSIEQYSIAGFEAARFEQITEAPRHYGFHGTLKAPFHLACGTGSEQLLGAAAALAAETNPFAISSLKLKWLGRFLALVPGGFSRELHDLAAACVRHFDAFRAPPSREELAKRRSSQLTATQEKLLDRWGYPYVMEEFRFHLTLTGPMDDEAERNAVFASAELLSRPLRNLPVPISTLCIFRQPDRQSPFRLIHRVTFRSRVMASDDFQSLRANNIEPRTTRPR